MARTPSLGFYNEWFQTPKRSTVEQTLLKQLPMDHFTSNSLIKINNTKWLISTISETQTPVALSVPPNNSSEYCLIFRLIRVSEIFKDRSTIIIFCLFSPPISEVKFYFRNTQNTLGTNTGTNSQDIVWFAIRNVDKIDMGSKNLGTCINRAMVAVMESTDQDMTGCVGHARNVDW